MGEATMSNPYKELIEEAHRRSDEDLNKNISYPSRGAAKHMRDLVKRLADALEASQGSILVLLVDDGQDHDT